MKVILFNIFYRPFLVELSIPEARVKISKPIFNSRYIKKIAETKLQGTKPGNKVLFTKQ